MGLDADEQKVQHEKQIIKDHRKRRGILRKEQLELMNQYDEEMINSIIKINYTFILLSELLDLYKNE